MIWKSKFCQKDMTYKVPDCLIYPVLSAFRSCVVYNSDTEKYEWKNSEEPVKVWERCKRELTSKVMTFAVSIGDNPNAVGKDTNIWDLAYMTVMLQK